MIVAMISSLMAGRTYSSSEKMLSQSVLETVMHQATRPMLSATQGVVQEASANFLFDEDFKQVTNGNMYDGTGNCWQDLGNLTLFLPLAVHWNHLDRKGRGKDRYRSGEAMPELECRHHVASI